MLVKERLVFLFPPQLIEEPVTYNLIKKYDVKVNILRAKIVPGEYGRLVVEMSGDVDKMDAALEFVTGLGVEVQSLAREVRWQKELCIECTACTSVCPTQALSVKPPGMRLRCEHEKCIACELCVPVCPYHAIQILA